MIDLNTIVKTATDLDSWFEHKLSQHEFTHVLVHNVVSKYITEALFLIVTSIICYETFYWSGIYLGLWEYHAKDIFKEVPIHCAHVYIKVNLAKRENAEKICDLYQVKKKNRYNVMEWTAPKQSEKELFILKDSVKYHFEFSPEDFEENPEPEYGSTVEHLRKRVLSTITSSSVYVKYLQDITLSAEDVLVFNSKYDEVRKDNNKEYLSKIGIETGNLINCIVLI